MISALLSSCLPGCQFPGFHVASGGGSNGGDGGAAIGGMPPTPAGAPNDAGEAGRNLAGVGGEEPGPSVPCEPEACVPRASGGWQGPIAFWEGKGSSVPDAVPSCPPDFPSATDVHRGLNAPASACKCTCAAEGQVCDQGTKLELFTDMGCASPCATTSVHSCDSVSGNCGSQGSLRAAMPVATGGSCQPTVTMPATASWQWDARICESSNARTCDDPAQVCAPPPPAPYVSRLCVFSVILEAQSPPACPADYPAPHEPLYATFSDDRGCSACACSSVSGGTCTGTVTVSDGDNCVGPAEYNFGGGCRPFDLGPGNVRPNSAGAEYSLTPGSCSVASAPHATGNAAPSGNVTVVCCRQ